MFCPDCEGEFREGIARCPDCEVELVAELPRVLAGDIVPVFEALNQLDLELARSTLESAGIPSIVLGEHILRMSEGGGVATVFVPTDRLAEAGALLGGMTNAEHDERE
jgi:hypothetical protein